MFIKTSKEFKEGARFAISSNQSVKEVKTVQKAWENTGTYIQKAIKNYGEKYARQKP